MDDFHNFSDTANLNERATIKQAKAFLKAYPYWHLQKQRLAYRHNRLLSASDASTDALLKSDDECKLRTDTLEIMGQTNEQLGFLADLLNFRFIRDFQINKVCNLLTDKYHKEYISERTFSRYQNQALLAFAIACPKDLTVKK